jgi:hypothetical protein
MCGKVSFIGNGQKASGGPAVRHLRNGLFFGVAVKFFWGKLAVRCLGQGAFETGSKGNFDRILEKLR